MALSRIKPNLGQHPRGSFRLDRSHPMARGLVFAANANALDVANLVDLSAVGAGLATRTGAAAKAYHPQHGQVMDFAGGGKSFSWAHRPAYDLVDELTLATWVYPVIRESGVWIGKPNDTINSFPPYDYGLVQADSTTRFQLLLDGFQRARAQELVLDEWQLLIGRAKLGSPIQLFKNGLEVSAYNNQDTYNSAISPSDVGLYIGMTADGVSEEMTGRWLSSMVWNRALTNAEIFDLWAPQTRWDLYERVPIVVSTAVFDGSLTGSAAISMDVASVNGVARALSGDGSISMDVASINGVQRALAGSVDVSFDVASVNGVVRPLAGDGSISADVTSENMVQRSLSGSASISMDVASINGVARALSADGSISMDVVSVNTKVAGGNALTGSATISMDVASVTGAAFALTGDGVVSFDIGSENTVQRALSGSAAIEADVASVNGVQFALSGDATISMDVDSVNTKVAGGDALGGSASISLDVDSINGVLRSLDGSADVSLDVASVNGVTRPLDGTVEIALDVVSVNGAVFGLGGSASISMDVSSTNNLDVATATVWAKLIEDYTPFAVRNDGYAPYAVVVAGYAIYVVAIGEVDDMAVKGSTFAKKLTFTQDGSVSDPDEINIWFTKSGDTPSADPYTYDGDGVIDAEIERVSAGVFVFKLLNMTVAGQYRMEGVAIWESGETWRQEFDQTVVIGDTIADMTGV